MCLELFGCVREGGRGSGLAQPRYVCICFFAMILHDFWWFLMFFDVFCIFLCCIFDPMILCGPNNGSPMHIFFQFLWVSFDFIWYSIHVGGWWTLVVHVFQCYYMLLPGFAWPGLEAAPSPHSKSMLKILTNKIVTQLGLVGQRRCAWDWVSMFTSLVDAWWYMWHHDISDLLRGSNIVIS